MHIVKGILPTITPRKNKPWTFFLEGTYIQVSSTGVELENIDAHRAFDEILSSFLFNLNKYAMVPNSKIWTS